MSRLVGFLVFFILCLSTSVSLRVSLSRVSTLYLPTYTDDGHTYSYDTMTLEQLAFHPQSKIIYGVGNGIIHFIDASDVNSLREIDHIRVPELDFTDIEVCGDGVFISYVNKTDNLKSGVLVYRAYNTTSRDMRNLHDIKLGSLPDMVYPTADCTVLVAVENEGVVIDGQLHDLPGAVAVLRFPQGLEATPTVKLMDFAKFDSRFDELSKSGVRWVYRANNNFSNNIEPEYITYNHDYSKAYICLQENNAIAVVDMATETITDIHGLGFKQWGDLDPSDRDGGINIQEWPVYGMYLPDSIHWVSWNGQNYVITANEGDSQVYGGNAHFDETSRGNKFHENDFATTVSDDLKQALSDDSKLGRLVFSNVDGKNSEGKYEKFYTYGGRSFSLYRASDMTQAYDSGNELAALVAQLRPDLFNGDAEAQMTLADNLDTRSDNKGMEVESLAVAELQGHLLVFVGMERPGMIAVYSAAPSAGLKLQLQQLFSEGIPQNRTTDTFQQLYDDQDLFAIDPEYIQYFSSSDGLADFPALLVGGSVSGTVTILRINVEDTSAKCSVCSGENCDQASSVMTCSPSQSLCVTNVTSTAGRVTVSRGCADETLCDQLYLQYTLSNQNCADLSSASHLPNGASCHFCCVGDNCNRLPDIIPDNDSLYRIPIG